MIVCHFFPKWLISPSLFLAHNALHSELILFMVLVLDSGEHLRLKMFYTIKQMQSANMFVCKFWDTGRSDSALTTVGCCNLNWNEQHAARSGVQVLDILCTSISFDSFLYDLTVIMILMWWYYFFFVFVKQYRTKKTLTTCLLVFFNFWWVCDNLKLNPSTQ